MRPLGGQRPAQRRSVGALIPGGLALHASNIGVTFGWAPRLLTFPQHFPQAVHGFVVGLVQGVAFVGKQFDGLAYASGLVDAALLTDRQVHRQVQKRVGAALLRFAHAGQCGVYIGKVLCIFGVLIHPLACYGFNSF